MLVLSRRLREQIRIGDHITITVLAIKGQGVRLGIDAPKNVRVLRSELKKLLSDEVVAAEPCEESADEEEAAVDGGEAAPAHRSRAVATRDRTCRESSPRRRPLSDRVRARPLDQLVRCHMQS